MALNAYDSQAVAHTSPPQKRGIQQAKQVLALHLVPTLRLQVYARFLDNKVPVN